MDLNAATPKPTDLATTITAAQADLAAACESGPFRHDPYRHILTGLSKALSAFGQGSADVIAARNPLSLEERAGLVQELIAATERGATAGMRAEARRFIRVLDDKLLVRIIGAVCGAFGLGIVLTLAVAWWLGFGAFDRDVQAAVAWRDLEQLNPDPRPSLAEGIASVDRSGRRFKMVPLWTEAAPPPPTAR